MLTRRSKCVRERHTHLHNYIHTYITTYTHHPPTYLQILSSLLPPFHIHRAVISCPHQQETASAVTFSCSNQVFFLFFCVITVATLVSADIFRVCGWQCVLFLMKVLHTGDVIAFYNSVFVPAVKTDLLRINQDRASLARPPVTESLLGASPARSYNR